MTASHPSRSNPPSSSVSDWFDRRAAQRRDFLSQHGWGDAPLTPIGEDSAFRRYFRLRQGDRSVIFMESMPESSGKTTPGHNLRDFVRISDWLQASGLKAPEIYAADEDTGYMLLEDFGDLSFRQALADDHDARELYDVATDVLVRLRHTDADGIDLPDYYQSHVHAGRRRLVDWFMPAVRQQKNDDGLVEDYLRVWDEIEKALPPCPQGFLHIDFHVENLMWREKAGGTDRCGLLDFQGAMKGPLPYDLANLLEDARMDVSPEMRTEMLDRFCADMEEDERKNFKAWYRVLATQFHCRVIGQFIRLAVKDDKTRYLEHLPRLGRYLADDLADPLLKPMKDWLDRQGVDVTAANRPLDLKRVASFIRPDAF